MGIPAPTVPCDIATFKDSTGNLYQAGSYAYAACQQFNARQNENTFRYAIAGLQALTQYYFADKQYEVAKQQQNRQDADSTVNRDRSAITFGQFTKGIPCEDALREEACAEIIPAPDLNDIRRQAEASVSRTYAPLRQKILDCTPVHCMASACNTLTKLAIEQASAVLSLTQQMMRQAMAKWELDRAASRSFRYQMVGLGRGYVGNSTTLMQAASANSTASSQQNPYNGVIQATNSTFASLQSAIANNANNFVGNGINVGRQGTPVSANGSQVSDVGPPDWMEASRQQSEFAYNFQQFESPGLSIQSDGGVGKNDNNNSLDYNSQGSMELNR